MKTETRHALARISLRWMISQCFIVETGIQFTVDALQNVGFRVNDLWQTPRLLDPSRELELGPRLQALVDRFHGDTADTRHTRVYGITQFQTWLERSPEGNSTLPWEEEEFRDLLCPQHDQLTLEPRWWLFEILPLVKKVQVQDVRGQLEKRLR